MDYQVYYQGFIDAARKVAKHGLVICRSGNLSWRVDEEHMLVTMTSSWMDAMTKDQIAVCRIADGTLVDGQTPSKEIGFHAGILQKRQDVNVVLHYQSPSATSIACLKGEPSSYFVIPEIPYYIGPVAMVPYLNPGSVELAEAVTSAMKEHDLAILRNHGQVTVGKDFDEAIEKAAYFELACSIILNSGEDVRVLPEEAVDHLRQARRTIQTSQ